MDWLRLRKRAIDATFIEEYPTDARRSQDDPRHAADDPELERGRKLRRRVIVVLLYTIFIAGSVAALFGKRGMLDLLRINSELQTARAELAQQQAAVERLRDQVEALETDPTARERIAREELGMARPGEVVFLLPYAEGEDHAAPSHRAP